MIVRHNFQPSRVGFSEVHTTKTRRTNHSSKSPHTTDHRPEEALILQQTPLLQSQQLQAGETHPQRQQAAQRGSPPQEARQEKARSKRAKTAGGVRSRGRRRRPALWINDDSVPAALVNPRSAASPDPHTPTDTLTRRHTHMHTSTPPQSSTNFEALSFRCGRSV